MLKASLIQWSNGSSGGVGGKFHSISSAILQFSAYKLVLDPSYKLVLDPWSANPTINPITQSKGIKS